MLRLIAFLLLASGASIGAQLDPQLRSGALVRELTALLTQRGLDSVAAQDPQDPAHFTAVLLFPITQLLVVSARSESPAALAARLAHKEYRDVYLDLASSSGWNGKWFLQDMQADGLCAARDQTADVLYDNAESATVLDANWRHHAKSEREYAQLMHQIDDRYSQLLTILIGQLR